MKVEKREECWVWTGAMSGNGYGSFFLGRIDGKKRNTSAHRFSYELHSGPVPSGLHIDHLCRNRGCVRPEHLEAVTQAENNVREFSWRSSCYKGHEYDEMNTYWDPNGHRRCRQCRRDRDNNRTGAAS